MRRGLELPAGKTIGRRAALGEEDVLQVADPKVVPGELEGREDLGDQGAERPFRRGVRAEGSGRRGRREQLALLRLEARGNASMPTLRSTITRCSGRVFRSIQPDEHEVPEVALEGREVERAQLSLQPCEGAPVVGRDGRQGR